MKNFILIFSLLILFSCTPKSQENENAESIDPREQYIKSLQILDSVLNIRENELTELLKNFYIEDENTTVPVFIHKKQSTKINHDRAYVRAHATKNGNLYLASHYVGQSKINHRLIALSCGENSVQTNTVNIDALNHTFEIDGLYYEIVKFKENPDAVNFIAENFDQKITLTFIGNNRKFKTFLSETDKKSIRETWQLANTFSEISDIKAQMQNIKTILY